MATPPIPKEKPLYTYSKTTYPRKRNALIENLLDLIIISEGTNLDKTLSKNKNPYNTIVGYDEITFDKPLTEMTIKEVRENGRSIVNATRGIKGKDGSSAVGAFQMLSNEYNNGPYSSTVGEFQKKLNLSDDTLFTKEVQRELAKAKIIEMTNKGKLLDNFVANPSETNLKSILNKLGEKKGWQGIPTKSNPDKPRINFNKAISSIGTDEGAFQPNIIDINVIDSELDINDQTKNMLQRERADDPKNNKMDEQEIDSKPMNPESLQSQREKLRAITKEKSDKLKEFQKIISGFKLIREAGATDLGSINDQVARINADDTKDKMGVTTPPTDAASDAFQADQKMKDYNKVNEDENLFRGSRNKDTEVELLGGISYPEDPIMSLDDDQGGEYTGQDYTISDNSEGFSFFRSLFTNEDPDTDIDDYIDEGIDYFADEANPLGGEADPNKDVLNFEHGGTPEADFDGKEEDAGDPPPLATPKEVADDIPAMLSEGEYVLPANVVRYIGLERVMGMHRQVLSEIQQMEDLGMIQNVDKNGEPEEDDKEMKFLESEKPEEGEEDISKGTIIIASSRPTGIMSKEPLKFAPGGSSSGDDGSGGGVGNPSGGPNDASEATGGPEGPTGEMGGTAPAGPNQPGGPSSPPTEKDGGNEKDKAETQQLDTPPNEKQSVMAEVYDMLSTAYDALGLQGTKDDREAAEAEASQPGDMDPNLELENNLDNTIKPEEIETTSLDDDHIFISGVGYVPRGKVIEGLMSPQV